MKLVLHEFQLPLQHEFRISREAITTQPTLIVELQAEGHAGFGEATTNAYYGVTLESMRASLERHRAAIESSAPNEPEDLWDQLAPGFADDPFAQCALDQAAHDLAGKIAGVPVYQRWGLDNTKIPASNYTIGIAPVDEMVAKLQERPGWPIYKIKLGTDKDLEIVRRLRAETDAVFRVDANCGWTAEETIRNAKELATLNVEFIEQPLPADDRAGQQHVFAESVLPIIADESCIVPADVARCAGYFHGINIKLVKCGGLTSARRMIDEARSLDLKVMVGCMTESTVGISAIAQLLPLLDFVDMDGATLLAADIAEGVQVTNGICRFADRPGTGAVLLATDQSDS